MSDNRRVYCAMKKALYKAYPSKKLKGHAAQHLNTLAGFVAGIVQSKSCQLPKIAAKTPDKTKNESRVRRYTRFLKHKEISDDVYYFPYIETVLERLAQATIVLAIDGSVMGRNCITLMISVIYKKRALPLVWTVVEGKKGHFPTETHIALLKRVQALLPEGSDVVLIGDGEFDSVELQQTAQGYSWEYVCRTAKNSQLLVEGEKLSMKDMQVAPNECKQWDGVSFSGQAYGTVQVIAWWDSKYKEPIYLVTNMVLMEEACHFYAQRMRVETLFSDQKSRGFNIAKSHLSDPERLSLLLLAVCLAYLWIIFLGGIAKKDNWRSRIHRTDRCDLSLFQLGLRLLDHWLDHRWHLAIALVPGASHQQTYIEPFLSQKK